MRKPYRWFKPQLNYWEHDDRPHQCNHYNCNGIIIVDDVIDKEDPRFILGHGHCRNCGQDYLICEPVDWYKWYKQERQERQERAQPVKIPEPASKREAVITIKI